MIKQYVPLPGLKRKRKKNGRNSGLTPSEIKTNPDLHRRNKLQWLANLELCRLRLLARQEYLDFMSAYQKRWLGVIRSANSSPSKSRRRERLKASTSHSAALRIQTEFIKYGPCKCFWCEKFLPKGGTVDHIRALAKGGRHSSENVCAACVDCNTAKGEDHHNNTAAFPSLF